MVDTELQQVCRQIAAGAKFQLGRNPAGSMRLRLHSGPFGLFVKRFELTDDDFQQLKLALNKRHKGKKKSAHIGSL